MSLGDRQCYFLAYFQEQGDLVLAILWGRRPPGERPGPPQEGPAYPRPWAEVGEGRDGIEAPLFTLV